MSRLLSTEINKKICAQTVGGAASPWPGHVGGLRSYVAAAPRFGGALFAENCFRVYVQAEMCTCVTTVIV